MDMQETLKAGEWQEKIKEAAVAVSRVFAPPFEAAVILGSGLGAFTENLESASALDYDQIPHFPVSSVEGHQGKLWCGISGGKRVLAMAGRFHYYEGYTPGQVIFPVRVMAALGIKKLIVTNAAGGIKPDWEPGTLMLISDHINLMGMSPLRGENHPQWGPRFPDLTEAYPKNLRELAEKSALKLGIPLKEGVYVGMSGPHYETPAEIDFLRIIGGSAVGMSTVPEVIAANQQAMAVLGISCITNPAAGVSGQPLNHQEVLAGGDQAKTAFVALLEEILKDME